MQKSYNCKDFIMVHTKLLFILVVPKRFYCDQYKTSLYTDGSQEDFIMIHTNLLYSDGSQEDFIGIHTNLLYSDGSQEDFIGIHTNLLSILMVPKKI